MTPAEGEIAEFEGAISPAGRETTEFKGAITPAEVVTAASRWVAGAVTEEAAEVGAREGAGQPGEISFGKCKDFFLEKLVEVVEEEEEEEGRQDEDDDDDEDEECEIGKRFSFLRREAKTNLSSSTTFVDEL